MSENFELDEEIVGYASIRTVEQDDTEAVEDEDDETEPRSFERGYAA
jgi:hypothetical protein